jgi:hypothetical protein
MAMAMAGGDKGRGHSLARESCRDIRYGSRIKGTGAFIKGTDSQGVGDQGVIGSGSKAPGHSRIICQGPPAHISGSDVKGDWFEGPALNSTGLMLGCKRD